MISTRLPPSAFGVARISQVLPGLKRFGIENGASYDARLRPVVAKTLPDQSQDRPRVALRHVRPRLALVVDGQVLGMDVTPQGGTAR